MKSNNLEYKEKNNIMNKTFEAHHKPNYLLDNDYQQSSQMLDNNDLKAQTLSLFGINKENLISDLNNNNNRRVIIKQSKFELEHIYRDRLYNLYKNKTKEELLDCFIESEINNVILRKEIEKDKLMRVKLENKIIDLQQENIVIRTKMKNLSEINEDSNLKFNGENKLIKEENDLLLSNSSFVQKELNIKNEFNNMDIDSLLINKKL